jgi:hypothetical protein
LDQVQAQTLDMDQWRALVKMSINSSSIKCLEILEQSVPITVALVIFRFLKYLLIYHRKTLLWKAVGYLIDA